MIGVDSSGTMAVPNDIGMVVSTGTANNIIGGSSASERNIFSGNNLSGLMITNQLTENNMIKGNYFGTDITGTIAIPNLYGVMFSTYTKHNTLDSNLISGNILAGLIINEEADSNIITGNKIGTDISGTQNLGNGSGGIYIDQGAKYNTIGTQSSPNIIAFNSAGGILIKNDNSKFNKISGNSIFENDGLGIDIFPFGVINTNDAGDVDTGPADMLNSPVIDMAQYNSGNTFIEGYVDCPNPLNSMIEIFVASPDISGCGQGKRFVGIALPDINGNWNLSTNSLLPTDIITATTIDNTGNTSEFSQNSNIITGIIENQYLQVSIYPNPCSEYLTITIPESKQNYVFSVYNIQGKSIKKTAQYSNVNNIIWDLKDDKAQRVPSGQYVISLSFGNGYNISKLITIL
jgi:titin